MPAETLFCDPSMRTVDQRPRVLLARSHYYVDMPDAATYLDYLWTQDERSGFDSFCITFVEGLTRAQVIAALPVLEEVGTMSWAELARRTWEDWDGERMRVGLSEVDGSTVMYEINGWVGVDSRLMPTIISFGQRVLAHHYSDGNGMGTLTFHNSGTQLLCMEPLLGITQDLSCVSPHLMTLMREVGFGADDPDGDVTRRNHAAAFALCERITGHIRHLRHDVLQCLSTDRVY